MDSLEAADQPLEFSARLKGLLVVHALLPFGWVATREFNDIFVGAMFSVIVYQYGLMGLWTGLGPWPFGARVGGVLFFNFYVLCVSFLAIVVAAGNGPPPGDDVLKFVALFGFSISSVCIAPYLVLNAWLKLSKVENPGQLDREYVSSFGVRHLLGITFCYGVVVAAIGALKQGVEPPIGVAFAILLGPLITGLIVLTWAILSPRIGWLKLLVAFLANGFAALLMVVQFSAPPQVTLFALPGIAVFIASLVVLRSDGYRLVRRHQLLAHVDAGESVSPFDTAEISRAGAPVFEKDV